MFLIEWSTGQFVDAKKIDCINANGGRITFSINGDVESEFTVSIEQEREFINHVNVLNENISKLTPQE